MSVDESDYRTLHRKWRADGRAQAGANVPSKDDGGGDLRGAVGGLKKGNTMSDLLRQELQTKKRALGHIRLDLAKRGISADPYLRMEEEDLIKDIHAIERELGITQTPTIQERRAYTPLPCYVAPPEPEPVFQQRMVGQERSMRQADIEHQMSLLNIHRRNLGHLRSQLRELGAHAPPYVRNGVLDAMGDISRIKTILRDMGQTIDALPGDE